MEAPFFKRYRFIGGVQKRATKLISTINDELCEDRLRYVNLTTLETRRLRSDLIAVFKIFKGFDDLNTSKFFDLSQAHTRGHSLKLMKPRCRLDIRKFSFAYRVIDIWNIIECDSINGFKTRIDKFVHGRGFI